MLEQLRQIAVFAKTVEAGSFRGAARQLGLSPSVVSYHVSQLEKQLGVALLYRSTRKLSLTRDGERMMQSAQAMLAAVESGLDSISTEYQPVGELRVSMPAVMALSPLIDRVGDFTRAFPQVGLQMSFTDLRQDVFTEGIDVIIRMGWLEDSNLKARKLAESSRVLVGATSYLASKQKPKKPRDLLDWDWLGLQPVGPDPEFNAAGNRRQRLKFSPRIVVDNAIALFSLCKGGNGIAIVPEFLAKDDIESGLVQVILPDWRVKAAGIYALWPANAPKQGLTHRFVEALSVEPTRGKPRLKLPPNPA